MSACLTRRIINVCFNLLSPRQNRNRAEGTSKAWSQLASLTGETGEKFSLSSDVIYWCIVGRRRERAGDDIFFLRTGGIFRVATVTLALWSRDDANDAGNQCNQQDDTSDSVNSDRGHQFTQITKHSQSWNGFFFFFEELCVKKNRHLDRNGRNWEFLCYCTHILHRDHFLLMKTAQWGRFLRVMKRFWQN